MTATPPGHREAVALLAAEAARARAGSGRLVLLRGATGTGRTTVLEAGTEEAQRHGMRVLRARCSPADTTMSMAVVQQLLNPVPEFSDLAADSYDRAHAARMWRLLRSYADQGPLLVAVDDVHLADADSRRWLAEAALRIDRLPLLMAMTERSQYDVDPPGASVTHALPPSLVRTHTLGPLTPESATALVRAEHPVAHAAWVEDCVRAGAGNPLLLRALLDDLGGGRLAAVPETCAALYPGAYPAAVSWWLDNAGPMTGEVARALAALDEGWSDQQLAVESSCTTTGLPGLIGAMTGADPARVSGWITAMTRLGVLRTDASSRPRYAHPLLRDAVLTGVPVTRRQAAHRAAAEAMVRHGASPEAAARQLLRADAVGEEWALAALTESAEQALRDSRLDDAAVLLRRALDEPMPDERRQRLLTELGSLEYAAAHPAAGLPRLAEALRLATGPRDRTRAAVALGTALAGLGRTPEAVETLRGLAGELEDHPELARTLWNATVLLSDHDQHARAEAYQWLRDTAAAAPQLVGTAGMALLVRYSATAGLVSAEEAMRQVRALLAEPADTLTEPFLVGTAAVVAQWADELDEAERLVRRGLAGQPPFALHPMREALRDTKADIDAARGDHARLLSETPGVAPGQTGPTSRLAHAVLAMVETGRLEEAKWMAESFDLRDAPDSWYLNRFLYARGAQRAAAGDAAGALHDFLECGRRQSAREVVSPVVTPWRTAAAECHLTLGNPGEALALAEEELRLARVWNTPRTVGRALRVLAVATGGRHGMDLAEEAVRTLRDSPAETELVTALLTQGRLLAAAGERARARDVLREAAVRAERRGAVRLRRLAEEALREGGARRTGAAHSGSGALTGSERRIAELAAAGHTNAEIGELLHLARRTVETHLTSAYRKLGIRRRAELRPVLESDGEAEPSGVG